jgi:tetratricopeptide (TPR) repeat protein
MLQKTITTLAVFFCFVLPVSLVAQPTWTLDPFGKEKKPEQFENRTLGSEKTATKKFNLPRHFIQNNVTHYNYYFNANNKVNLVVEKAKIAHKDDYSNLLSFYPYSLDNTATEKVELDSVIYTSTAGILIHDLRNDWIDNLYLLIGKAYYYRKDFDSAAMTFQFINYNLFPRKKHEDDDKIVGTTESSVGSSISIADKEKRNFIKKIVSLPPSRNDALIWLIRTFVEQGEYADAGGLINTLQNDPNVPKRLRNDLDEVASYWYFKQAGYDSAASHLEKALSNADDKQDKSRWEFLLAQLLEMNGQYDKASHYYMRAAKHTVDPLMDIYARLNEAKMLKGGNPKELDKNIETLVKMARRDKYEAFRDIMYYSAGQLSLQKPDTAAALGYFAKSVKYNDGNIPYKNKAFADMGDIAFARKKYRLAASLYDSIQTGGDSTLGDRKAMIETRKAALNKIVAAITAIEKEDSLQHIAGMTASEREDVVRKLLRKMRKEMGLKEDRNSNAGVDISNPFGDNRSPQDLFAANSPKGEWYFSNASMKSKGFNEFKSKWGNRANVDNWRRVSVAAINSNVPNNSDVKGKSNNGNASAGTEPTIEDLMKDVPTTPEKLAASNEVIATNLFALGKLYQNELEEYELAATTYEDYLVRFPQRLLDGEVYLNLYFCYTKMGNKAKADYYKNLLNSKFSASVSAKTLTSTGAGKNKNPEATKLYDHIYELFIEGNFDEAIAQKKKADETYGVNYWTPQLLYIEALYNVKQRNDSLAISGLQNIISFYPNSQLKSKAENMIAVLRRRSEIESYLTSLQVTRDTTTTINLPPDAPTVKKVVAATKPSADSTKKMAPLTNGKFTINVNEPHFVLMVLDKVAGVYVNEAKNALTRYNKENYYSDPLLVNKEGLDADRNLLIISPFTDATAALKYYDKLKKDVRSEMSWLPANKYSFLIITDQNLQLLKANMDLNGYKSLLNTQFPNRF